MPTHFILIELAEDGQLSYFVYDHQGSAGIDLIHAWQVIGQLHGILLVSEWSELY